MIIDSRSSFLSNASVLSRVIRTHEVYFGDAKCIQKDADGVMYFDINGRLYVGDRFVVKHSEGNIRIRLSISKEEIRRPDLGSKIDIIKIDWAIALHIGHGVVLHASGSSNSASVAEECAYSYSFDAIEKNGITWYGIVGQVSEDEHHTLVHTVRCNDYLPECQEKTWIALVSSREVITINRNDDDGWKIVRTIYFKNRSPINISTNVKITAITPAYSSNSGTTNRSIRHEVRQVINYYFEALDNLENYLMMESNSDPGDDDQNYISQFPLHLGIAGYFKSSSDAELHVGDKLVLEREYDNVHDQNAIGIKSRSSSGIDRLLHVGYIPRKDAEYLAALIDMGKALKCTLANIDGEYRDAPLVRVDVRRAEHHFDRTDAAF